MNNALIPLLAEINSIVNLHVEIGYTIFDGIKSKRYGPLQEDFINKSFQDFELENTNKGRVVVNLLADFLENENYYVLWDIESQIKKDVETLKKHYLSTALHYTNLINNSEDVGEMANYIGGLNNNTEADYNLIVVYGALLTKLSVYSQYIDKPKDDYDG